MKEIRYVCELCEEEFKYKYPVLSHMEKHIITKIVNWDYELEKRRNDNKRT